MVVTIQSLGGRHPRACTVGCYKRDKNKIKIYIYMRTDKCCCNCQKKYIHIFVYVYSFTQPGTRRTQRLRLPSKRHATLPCTGSFYRLGLHATRHTRVLSRGRKKRRKGQKTMESQIETKIQLDSQQLYDKNTCTCITRKGGGTVGGAA